MFERKNIRLETVKTQTQIQDKSMEENFSAIGHNHNSNFVLSNNSNTPCSVNNGNACLGIITGTSSSLVPQGFSEGDLIRLKRAERWMLKSFANKILYSLKKEGSSKLPRTCSCSKYLAPKINSVSVLSDPENKRSHFGGLQRCASVWRCPLCAAKISERRRVELVSANEVARAKGLNPYLITLTVKHSFGDKLNNLLDKMLLAMKYFVSGRSAAAFRSKYGYEGTIRALEVTYGKNGFHPHFHILTYLNKPLASCKDERTFEDQIKQFNDELAELWINCCDLAGLEKPDKEHGVMVSDGSYAATYASKWGIENELTKSHLKQSKELSSPDDKIKYKGKSIWDLLHEAGNGDEKAKALWLEFAIAFHGRRQLFWSKGLKEKLLIEDLTDEQIAEKEVEEAEILSIITPEQWRIITTKNLESYVLNLSEAYPDSLQDFLNELPEKYLLKSN